MGDKAAEVKDSLPQNTHPTCLSPSTLCTISSSVSNLAVSENCQPCVSFDDCPEPDTSLCPAKKKRISEESREIFQTEHGVSSTQPCCAISSPENSRKSCKGKVPRNPVNYFPKDSAHTGAYARQDSLSSDSNEQSVTESVAVRQGGAMEPVRDEMEKPSCRQRIVSSVRPSRDQFRDGNVDCFDVCEQKLVQTQNPATSENTLTPSQYHCHDFGRSHRETDENAGELLTHLDTSEGNSSLRKMNVSSVGCSGDASSELPSANKTENRTSLDLGPQWSAGVPISSISSTHATNSSSVTVSDGGDNEKSSMEKVEVIHTAALSGWSTASEKQASQCYAAGTPFRIDFSKLGAGSSFSINLSASSSSSSSTDTSNSHGSGAGAPSSTSSADCGTNATHQEPSLTSVLAPSTAYEMDTSGCSESSSESASSSDDWANQSSARVNSARINPPRIPASSQGHGKARREGKGRNLKKKTPSYGLKTDAVDALLGLKRSEKMKIKQLPGRHRTKKYSSFSGADKANQLFHVGKEFITIDDLPLILLVHIFSFLPIATRVSRVSLVCKKWQVAVLDPSLWRRLDLRNLPRLKDGMLLKLASLSDRVSALILSDGLSTLLTDDGVVKALQQCPHLKKVKFNRCFFFSDEAFESVGHACHNLVCLNLSGCFTVTDKTLLAISEGCRQLQDLDIGQCAKITDSGVCAVARGCGHLTRFRLDQCGKLTNSAVEAIAEGCPQLQYLHLLSCSLNDAGILHLAKLTKLAVLDISNVSQLSPRVVERVTASCPHLETLAISLNRAIDDQCLKHIVQHCPRLKCLSCVACSLSDAGLHHIARHAANLERLDVAWCSDITDHGIVEISAACPRLRYLGIMRCGLITMATVEELLLQYPHIQYSNFELDSRRLLGRAAKEGFRT
ncbi:hypothetical protein V1264_005574 [Littorina saxatilis]